MKDALRREASLLKSIDHPHIIKPIDVAEDVIVEETEMDVMVLPHRGHGDVFDLVKQNGGVSDNTTRYMA